MNKKDLIARIAKHNGMHPLAFSLASSDMTEASATARAKVLERRAAKLSRMLKLALAALGVAALALVCIYRPDTPATETTAYGKYILPTIQGVYAWFILVITFGLMAGSAKLTGDEWLANPDERRFLEAVTGTPKELDVASLLENGGPSVAAWRDVAVQEHGQLFGFDFEVMRNLFQIWAAEQREQRKQLEVAEAARMVEQAAAAGTPTAPAPLDALAA